MLYGLCFVTLGCWDVLVGMSNLGRLPEVTYENIVLTVNKEPITTSTCSVDFDIRRLVN